MADRAQYLARTLITRMLALEAVRREDGHVGADRSARTAVIEKIMAVELGVTDAATLSLVEAAVPHLRAKEAPTSREVTELAAFLRERLRRQLAEA